MHEAEEKIASSSVSEKPSGRTSPEPLSYPRAKVHKSKKKEKSRRFKGGQLDLQPSTNGGETGPFRAPERKTIATKGGEKSEGARGGGEAWPFQR